MAEKFHTELKNLKTETLGMAHLGRFMLRTAVDALISQDRELADCGACPKRRDPPDGSPA